MEWMKTYNGYLALQLIHPAVDAVAQSCDRIEYQGYASGQ
jgi:hypothetical protein